MPRDNITILDLNILKMERDFNNQHGYMFRFLVYVSLITTFILISYLKPHRFYNKFMSNIFNFSLEQIDKYKSKVLNITNKNWVSGACFDAHVRIFDIKSCANPVLELRVAEDQSKR